MSLTRVDTPMRFGKTGNPPRPASQETCRRGDVTHLSGGVAWRTERISVAVTCPPMSPNRGGLLMRSRIAHVLATGASMLTLAPPALAETATLLPETVVSASREPL